MKRRKWIQTVVAAPALAAGAAAQQSSTTSAVTAAAGSTTARSLDDPVKLALSAPGVVAEAYSPKFFSEPQFATLAALAGWILPARNGRPGAVEAGAPAFLDFLLSQSPAARQAEYMQGLDLLNSGAQRAHSKEFAKLDLAGARPLLAGLEKPWTFDPPSDPLERFLKTVKDDLFQATVNSRAWSESQSGRARGGAGLGQYYFSIE